MSRCLVEQGHYHGGGGGGIEQWPLQQTMMENTAPVKSEDCYQELECEYSWMLDEFWRP